MCVSHSFVFVFIDQKKAKKKARLYKWYYIVELFEYIKNYWKKLNIECVAFRVWCYYLN